MKGPPAPLLAPPPGWRIYLNVASFWGKTHKNDRVVIAGNISHLSDSDRCEFNLLFDTSQST